MTLKILEAISDKKQGFPFINRQVISRIVPGITENYSQIKGRRFNRSFVYRQVGRDDYPQPSQLEKIFDWWAAVRFRSRSRGELITAEVASWDEWADYLEERIDLRDFWTIEEVVESLMSQVRKCHVAGDALEERRLLLEIRDNIDQMVKMAGVSAVVVNGNGRVLGK